MANSSFYFTSFFFDMQMEMQQPHVANSLCPSFTYDISIERCQEQLSHDATHSKVWGDIFLTFFLVFCLFCFVFLALVFKAPIMSIRTKSLFGYL